jgi:hypothetical protein
MRLCNYAHYGNHFSFSFVISTGAPHSPSLRAGYALHKEKPPGSTPDGLQ